MNLFMWVAVRTGEFTLGDDQAKVQIMTARLAVTQTLINMLVKKSPDLWEVISACLLRPVRNHSSLI